LCSTDAAVIAMSGPPIAAWCVRGRRVARTMALAATAVGATALATTTTAPHVHASAQESDQLGPQVVTYRTARRDQKKGGATQRVKISTR